MNKLIYLLLFWSSLLTAQFVTRNDLQTLSDSELLSTLNKAREQGYSTEQIISFAEAKGATAAEVAQLRSRIIKLESSEKPVVNTTIQHNLTPNQFGDSIAVRSKEKSPIFGASFFNNPNISMVPALNLATPEHYQLGPGDKLLIEVWGAAAQTYQMELNRDGQISIPSLGPIYLNGLSVKAARHKLKNSLTQIYSGLQSTLESEKVFLNLSLLQARSIIINIIGQVEVPGTYTLNGFTTPLNALYACGGISNLGTYREVELIRNGKHFKTIDLYDYLTKGIPPKTLLRDQDIIRVPFFKTHVEIKGAVKQKKIFELLKGETVTDLISYAGGFTSTAYSDALTLERIEALGRTIISIPKSDYNSWTFQNGDILTAKTIGVDYKNRVLLEGAVNIGGTYEVSEVPTVKELLQKGGGLTAVALKTSALLYRQTDGIDTEIIPLDLTAILAGKKKVALEPNDRLVVLQKNAVTDQQAITIQGEVQNPGSYTYYDGMSLRDALLLSGGLTASAAQSIFIFEMETNAVGEFDYVLKQELNVDRELQLTEEQNIRLKPRTVLLINRDPAAKNIRYANISGEIHKPGKYLIKDTQYSVADLLEEAGGLTSKATRGGVYLLRNVSPGLQKITVDTLNLNTYRNQVRIPIEFKKAFPNTIKENLDLPLKNGDQLIVESYFNTVNINGEVLQETAVGYQKHLKLKHYVQAAGGFGQQAKKSKVFVIAQNGKITATKNFLGIRTFPKVSPGATIYVSPKVKRVKKSTQEVLGITTAITTLGLLVRSFIK